MAGLKVGGPVAAWGHASQQLPQDHLHLRCSMRQMLSATLFSTPASENPGKAVAEQKDGEASSTRLGNLIRSKQRILQSQLGSMAAEQLAERLAAVRPSASGNQLLEKIAAGTLEGKTTVIAEVARLSPAESPESLAERCKKYMKWGEPAKIRF